MDRTDDGGQRDPTAVGLRGATGSRPPDARSGDRRRAYQQLANPFGHFDSHGRYRLLEADRRIPRPVGREEAGVGEPSAAELVAAAAQGDSSAWDELVGRYSGLVWSVARAHRLSPADAADVTQTVWMRLVEHLGRIRDPAHVGGWLGTTTRNECLRVLRRSGREVPDDFTAIEQPGDPRQSPEWVVLSKESRRLVWLALGRLSQRCQMVLRTLSASPDASYAEISAALDIPIGSIGPTRMRCLEYLRKQLAQYGGLLDNGDG